jgi:hypothetical protein
MEHDFGLNFECRAINPRVGRYSISLRRAELPRQVRVIKVEPRSNAIQLNIQAPLDMGGLPLLEYIVKYERVGVPDSFQTQSFAGRASVNCDYRSNRTTAISVASDDNGDRSLRIESLQPSSLYRMQITAKSRAGEGSLSIPYQLKTLDRQVPQFRMLSSDMSCLADRTCPIKWIVDTDGSSPISRAEIAFGKVTIHRTVADTSAFVRSFVRWLSSRAACSRRTVPCKSINGHRPSRSTRCSMNTN